MSINSWQVGSEESTRQLEFPDIILHKRGFIGKTMVISQDKMKQYACIGTENEGRMYAS